MVNDVTQSQPGGSTIREIVESLVVLQANETIIANTFVVEDSEDGTVAKVLTLLSVTIRRPSGDRIVRLPLIAASVPPPPAGIVLG